MPIGIPGSGGGGVTYPSATVNDLTADPPGTTDYVINPTVFQDSLDVLRPFVDPVTIPKEIKTNTTEEDLIIVTIPAVAGSVATISWSFVATAAVEWTGYLESGANSNISFGAGWPNGLCLGNYTFMVWNDSGTLKLRLVAGVEYNESTPPMPVISPYVLGGGNLPDVSRDGSNDFQVRITARMTGGAGQYSISGGTGTVVVPTQ